MLVTQSGMLMLVSDLHLENAQSPMLVTLSGMLMLVREWHPENADFPMLATLSGMLMLVRDLQTMNVLLVDYQYYTLSTVEKGLCGFYIDTKCVTFNVNYSIYNRLLLNIL